MRMEVKRLMLKSYNNNVDGDVTYVPVEDWRLGVSRYQSKQT